jgi:phospholipase A2
MEKQQQQQRRKSHSLLACFLFFALCSSSLGVLIAFEKAGLLDCCTFLAGTSGGSWLVANAMTAPVATMEELKDHLKVRISKSFYDLRAKVAFSELKERLAQGAILTTVDDYSWFLAQHMFQDMAVKEELWSKPRLSEQTARISEGQAPLPLYTAVASADQSKYRWVELSPHETGIRDDCNTFIPSWSFGRRFQNGVSVDGTPEPSLAMLAATVGSGFTASVDQIFQNITKDEKLQRVMHHFLYSTLPSVGDSRLFSPAKFWNWAHEGVLGHASHLEVMDAGLAFNIPSSVPDYLFVLPCVLLRVCVSVFSLIKLA